MKETAEDLRSCTIFRNGIVNRSRPLVNVIGLIVIYHFSLLFPPLFPFLSFSSRAEYILDAGEKADNNRRFVSAAVTRPSRMIGIGRLSKRILLEPYPFRMVNHNLSRNPPAWEQGYS